MAPAKCRDLADLISRASREVELMQDEEALRLATLDLFRQLEEDGVVYAEVRFAPLLHTRRGLSPERVVEVVDAAVDRGRAETGVEARVILCALRHFSEEESLATARLAGRFRGSNVVALDLAGDEAGFPLEPHIAAFRHAREHGIHRTAHAGEARGPESVRETLLHLRPSRIGHGVRSREDPDLVERLKEEGIHLEVCPTSNVQSGVCDALEDHPVDELFRAGVSLGINTDGRTLCGVDLPEEYGKLRAAFGWGEEELRACNRSALDAAFAPEEVKLRVRARLAEGGAP